MSDIDSGLDNSQLGDEPSPVPGREGLPPRYRMRADAHYVEQLDSSLFSAPVRHIDIRSIDPLQRDGNTVASTAFIESIRRNGVLQPLLVRSRGGRFQVIAGGKRLAAAVEAGLNEVPCLVERVDDDQARALAAATNVPSVECEPLQTHPERPPFSAAFAAFADCLTAVASSAGLLSGGGTLTQTVAADLVRAEASRAMSLLLALRVLRGEVGPRRRPVLPRSVIQQAIEETAHERRLRGVTLTVNSNGADGPAVSGDEELLTAAVGGLVTGAAVLLDAPGPRTVRLGATARSDGSVAFTAEHEEAELSLFWRSTLAADDPREMTLPGGPAVTSALTLLRAARQVAALHGGRMTVDCLEGSTSLSIVIPSSHS